MKVLFVLQWHQIQTAGDWAGGLPGYFEWSECAFLSEMNEEAQADRIRQAEQLGLIYKVEELRHRKTICDRENGAPDRFKPEAP